MEVKLFDFGKVFKVQHVFVIVFYLSQHMLLEQQENVCSAEG